MFKDDNAMTEKIPDQYLIRPIPLTFYEREPCTRFGCEAFARVAVIFRSKPNQKLCSDCYSRFKEEASKKQGQPGG